ncbi:MAG: hypothetical protein RL755_364, partial [Pseudomonadota bacterium]
MLQRCQIRFNIPNCPFLFFSIRQQGLTYVQPLSNVGFKTYALNKFTKNHAVKFAFFCILSSSQTRVRYNYPNDYQFLVDK